MGACSFDRFLISVIVSIIFVVAAECTWYVKGCKRERERRGAVFKNTVLFPICRIEFILCLNILSLQCIKASF